MEALRASYGNASPDSDTSSDSESLKSQDVQPKLPPPPLDLLTPPNSSDYLQTGKSCRIRNFPHIDGSYAVHVYIPVYIPPASKKELTMFLKKLSFQQQDLHAVDVDILLHDLIKDDGQLEKNLLAREFHISLGRTVPVRVHQIDSMVTMLRQKLQSHRRFCIGFSKYEVFINDDRTRTFLSLEVVEEGLTEIVKLIQSVNTIYKLHNLPEFYKDPRPHISLAWALGDIIKSLKGRIEEEVKRFPSCKSLKNCIFTSRFNGVECKIGNKTYNVCNLRNEQ